MCVRGRAGRAGGGDGWGTRSALGWAHTGGVEVERGGLGGGCGGGMLSESERMLGVSMAGVRCSKVCLEGEGVVRRARG